MYRQDSFAAQRNLSALVDFSNLINSSLDLKFILNNLLLTCFGKFHTTKGIIALFDEAGRLEIKCIKGFPAALSAEFPVIKLSEGSLDESVVNEFTKKHSLPFFQKIMSSQGLLGIIFLGERLSKKDYLEEDQDFLATIVNIAATAIENSVIVEKLKNLNRSLDSKVSMLSSLFELSKEFSGILDATRISKLIVYSIIGQLFVRNYAVVLCEKEGLRIIESKFPPALLKLLISCQAEKITAPLRRDDFTIEFSGLLELGVELIIPMQVKGETKGMILLGKRFNLEEFSESDIEFIYAIGSLAIISIENAKLFIEALEKQKMEEDLEIAREIQKNLFPQVIPKLHNFEIAAINVSSKQVGGDYYDLIKLDKNNCLFAIGDVSGKGVPASLLMASLQAFLKSICKQGMKLDDATGLLNDLVSENTTSGNFITFFWGILNDEFRLLTYVNAGHNPPLLIRDGRIMKFTKGGMLLGVVKTMVPYLSETIELKTGDVIILFTDGVTEAMNKDMEEFTDERFEELACQLGNQSVEEILFHIRAEVERYVDGAMQSDDITLMIIKVK